MMSEKMRLSWRNGFGLLVACLLAASNVMAKGPAKAAAPASQHAQRKYLSASGADQVLTSVYDPSTNSLRVEGGGNGSTATALQFGTNPPITLSTSIPSSGQVLEFNGTNIVGATLSGTGAATSIGLTAPSVFSVSGSPVTGSGTLALGFVNEGANLVFAGPSSGTAVAPVFRALTAADIPALNYQAPLSSYNAPSNEFLTGFTAPGAFTAAQPSFTNLAGTATLSQLPSTLAQFSGTITANDCAKWSSSGVLTDAGAACGSGGSLTIETNTTPNSSSSVLNLANGTNITFANSSGGTVTASVSGTLASAAIPAINLAASGNGGVTGTLGFANGGTGLTALGTSGQCLGTNGTALVWQACGSGGSGSMAIGGALSGGTNQAVLYVNASGQLAQDEANLNWNDAAKTLTVGNIVLNGGSATQTLTLPTAAMSAGPGSAISIGSNTGNVPSISANGGSVTPIAPINGDLGGSWTGAEVTGLHFGSTSVPLGATGPSVGQLLGWNGTSASWFANGGIGSVANNTASENAITQTFSASGNGTAVTLTTTGYQPFQVNDIVNVEQCTGGPEGNFTVTAETSTTITYSWTYSGTISGCVVTLTSQASSSSGTVTARIYPQPFAANQTIQVSGCSVSSFNAFPVTVTSVTPDTVTFTVAGASGTARSCTLSAGTANSYLMAITPNGATFPSGGNSGPVYVVTSGGGVSGNALYATSGDVACTMDAAASNTAGEYVVESSVSATECDATSAPGSAFVIGTMVSNSTAAGSTATVSIGGGYQSGSGSGFTAGGDLSGTSTIQNVVGLHFGSTAIALGSAPTSGQCLEYNGTSITGAACAGGGGLSGLTTNAVLKATSATTVSPSALMDNGTDVSSTEPVGLPSGTDAAPGIYFNATTGTGISYDVAAGEFDLSYGGSKGAGVFGNGIDLGFASRLVWGPSFDNIAAGLSADTYISSSSPIIDVGTGGPANTAGDLIGAGLGFALNNASTTGTTANTLTKLTGAPSTAVVAATTDTSGVIGITLAGAGTSGTVRIISSGLVKCAFDGATTAGDYVSISSTSAGDCHDAGAARPASGEIIGRALSTNAAAGTYQILEELENQ